jgi:hypothetical protein
MAADSLQHGRRKVPYFSHHSRVALDWLARVQFSLLLPKPHFDPPRLSIDVPHQRNLQPLFFEVFLVDTESIYPEPTCDGLGAELA